MSNITVNFNAPISICLGCPGNSENLLDLLEDLEDFSSMPEGEHENAQCTEDPDEKIPKVFCCGGEYSENLSPKAEELLRRIFGSDEEDDHGRA